MKIRVHLETDEQQDVVIGYATIGPSFVSVATLSVELPPAVGSEFDPLDEMRLREAFGALARELVEKATAEIDKVAK